MRAGNFRQIFSWCLFDFANSSFSAVISAVVFPVYYVSVVVGNQAGTGDLWWGRAISMSMAFVALTSPFMGGIADHSGKRKRLLFFYTFVCVVSVAGFSLLDRGTAFAGFLLIVLANIGMEGGVVFYNSFLPGITDREHQGRVSAWGYALGYVGSIISLIIALPLVRDGRYDETWIMISFFFLFFSLPAFIFLEPDKKTGVPFFSAAKRGGRYSWSALKSIWARKEVRKFLLAFLLYQDGVNTVIVFSSIFAATTLGFTAKELVGLYLAVQATALFGAFAMAKPIDAWGPKTVVILALLLWSSVAVAAFFIYSKSLFWILACAAGLGLGTVQAASRAFYAQFIPQGRENEYFGIYALVGKSSSIAGPLLFGSLSSAFGSQRPAILAISIFFIFGLILINTVRGGGPNIGAHAVISEKIQ
jgi:UMF1 family MFS transporter